MLHNAGVYFISAFYLFAAAGEREKVNSSGFGIAALLYCWQYFAPESRHFCVLQVLQRTVTEGTLVVFVRRSGWIQRMLRSRRVLHRCWRPTALLWNCQQRRHSRHKIARATDIHNRSSSPPTLLAHYFGDTSMGIPLPVGAGNAPPPSLIINGCNHM